ncbi:hypothetical protein Csa_017534, partial [Cucumis sativus]
MESQSPNPANRQFSISQESLRNPSPNSKINKEKKNTVSNGQIARSTSTMNSDANNKQSKLLRKNA